MLLDTAGLGAAVTALPTILESFLGAPQHQTLTEPPPFEPFRKMARLSRDVVVTEKVDGSNAQVFITDDHHIYAGSRTRWLKPGKTSDNFGFAAWVEDHAEELIEGLGPGRHFGEWWGRGIQCGYGLDERRFSLFNVGRWCSTHVGDIYDAELIDHAASYAPACCHVVPTLYRGPFCTEALQDVLDELRDSGSAAAPGFAEPEGIIVYHTAGGIAFKKTIVGDEKPKGLLH